MLVYFKLQFYMEDKYAKSGGIFGSIMLSLPSIFYAIFIAVVNYAYHLLATFLTEWGKFKYDIFIVDNLRKQSKGILSIIKKTFIFL